MRTYRLLLSFLVAAFALFHAAVFAAGPEPILLWPNGAPGAAGDEERDKPSLRAYLPAKDRATGTGVVVCPGGGYAVLATDHEGHQVAKWFNEKGIAAFVLQYRLGPRYRHPAPLQDAQRALRYVRAHAAEYGIAKRRVGIMGFSAGGHLASTAATHFDEGQSDAADPIDRESCRPDFAILCYPVISFIADFSHKGSSRNLLGENPDPALLKALSNETQVTDRTPPTFLFHTGDDAGVPVENSLAFYAALRKAGVPAELHAYQFGPHGVGLAQADPALHGWKDRLYDWLRASGLLADVQRAAVSGTILFQGEPLRWGMITFLPENDAHPIAWTMVSQGKFSIPANRGAVVGKARVEIRHLGSVAPRPTLEDVQVFGGLSAEIHSGNNALHFDVK